MPQYRYVTMFERLGVAGMGRQGSGWRNLAYLFWQHFPVKLAKWDAMKVNVTIDRVLVPSIWSLRRVKGPLRRASPTLDSTAGRQWRPR